MYEVNLWETKIRKKMRKILVKFSISKPLRDSKLTFFLFSEDGLENGGDLGIGDMMNPHTDSQSDSQSDRSSNSGEVNLSFSVAKLPNIRRMVVRP